MKHFWSETRCKHYTFCALAGVLIACIAVVWSDVAPDSALGSGDLPGFLTPAAILARGEGARVYDAALQSAVQRDLWPDRPPGFLMSVYPAPVFVFLLPLLSLGVVGAKIAFSVVMLGCAAFTGRAIARLNRDGESGGSGYPFAWLLLYLPFLISVVGAQNTALSCALLVATTAALLAHRYLLAGILCGLACYKPQFGALLIFWALVACPRARVLYGAGSTLALGYVGGAIWCGWGWPAAWLDALAKFAPQNFLVNGYQMTSLQSVAHGVGGPIGAVIAWVAAILLIVYVARATARMRGATSSNHLATYALWAPAIVLVSPQALFYDSALAVVGLLLGFNRKRVGDPWALVLAIVGGAIATVGRETFAVNLFPLLALGIFVYVAMRERAINPR